MDKQAVFDRVAKHLLTQQVRSMGVIHESRTPTCTYRGRDGLSCAIGCLIDDRYYCKDLEGMEIVDSPQVQQAVALSLHIGELDDSEITFLEELQRLHDEQDVEDWEEGLSIVAFKYGLTVEVI